MRPPPPLSVRDVLELPAMRGAVLLAGESGLDRAVTGVNIVEVPEVSRWLRGGEILFSAGFAWRNEPAQLPDALRTLDAMGVSALVLKLGTYLTTVPPPATAVADELGLPLVRLPERVAYMDVIDPLTDLLREHPLGTLQRISGIEQELLAPGLDEQSIEHVAGVLACQLGNPVCVVNLVDEVVVSAEESGRASTGPLGSACGPASGLVDVLELGGATRLTRVPARRPLGEGVVGLCVALLVGREVRGAVAVVEAHGSLDDFASFALTHAAQVVSFLLLKRLASLEGRGAAMSFLVDSLLRDELPSEEAVERALVLGLRLARPCAALVVGGGARGERGRAGGVAGGAAQADGLRRALSKALGGEPHALALEGETVTVLVQADAPDSDDALRTLGERLLSAATEEGWRAPGVGIGSPRSGLEGLRRSRAEALLAYQACQRRGGGRALRFASLGVERILAQIPPSALTLEYVRATLGALEDQPELLRTLQVFVETGGRKLETARRIPLHRSTLEYRLDKIANLLGVDLSLPERQFELWLALRLRQALGVARPARDAGAAGRG